MPVTLRHCRSHPSPPATSSTDAETYDVVVVGFGIAGGCAALEAARAGARVLLLEQAAVHGGTSSMSGGHFYLGGGTAVQRRPGSEDSADAMADYLMASTRTPTRRRSGLLRGVGRALRLARGAGVRVRAVLLPEKAVIQPGTEGLMFTGNEKVWPFREQVPPGAARPQGAGAR